MEQRKEALKQRLKKARKALADKKNSLVSISVPTLSSERSGLDAFNNLHRIVCFCSVEQMATHIVLKDKAEFLPRMIAYWFLKRRSRAGVPLLRRLQVKSHCDNQMQLFYRFKCR